MGQADHPSMACAICGHGQHEIRGVIACLVCDSVIDWAHEWKVGEES